MLSSLEEEPKPGVVAYTCSPRYAGGQSEDPLSLGVLGPAWEHSETPI
jgi:hypothetical protein